MELEKAVEAVKKEFENKKAGMTYPEIWDRDPRTATEEQPKGMPVDDLIEIPHEGSPAAPFRRLVKRLCKTTSQQTLVAVARVLGRRR